MRNLITIALFAVMMGCSSSDSTRVSFPTTASVMKDTTPRFKVGDKVTTPAGPGKIVDVQKMYRYFVDLGDDQKGYWTEKDDAPVEQFKKLED